MSRIETGDTIKCVHGASILTKDKEYIALKATDVLVWVICDNKEVESWYKDRFEKVSSGVNMDNKDTGIKHDQEKPFMALLPTEALEEEAWVWTFGAKKYGNWNWKKGLAYTRILSAILRHTVAIMKGEDKDPESGYLHAAHIRCCAGMLITFYKTNREDLDDRYRGDV